MTPADVIWLLFHAAPWLLAAGFVLGLMQYARR